MANYEFSSFDDAPALARAASQAWLKKVEETSKANRSFGKVLVAISGGRIARDFFEAVAAQTRDRQMSLAPAHFFWADERCVPPEDTESNFKVANELLFRALAIPPDHMHRIRGEIQPGEAARAAAMELRNTAVSFSAGQPVLDLVLLGMGEDGHVASLFPTLPPAIADSKETYLAVTGPKPPPQRITLSYGAIAAAGDVWVLASGPGKEQALQKSLMLNGQTPLARVLSRRGQTTIFSDIKVNSGDRA